MHHIYLTECEITQSSKYVQKTTSNPLLMLYFRSIVLDYDVIIRELDEEDKIFHGGALGNYRYSVRMSRTPQISFLFSLAGFTMILDRHVSHYIITYYLPSGLFVVVSWISFLVPADVIPGILSTLSSVHI